jgi:hypothetical protein
LTVRHGSVGRGSRRLHQGRCSGHAN